MNTLNTRELPEDRISLVMKKLITHAKLNASSLAKALNFPAPTINRLLTGEVKDPRASTLLAIANFFHISVDQVLGLAPLPDKFDNTREASGESTTRPPMTIPLLTMTQAIDQQKHQANPTKWFPWLSKDALMDHNDVFAVQIKNDLYSPTFNKESLIIVDPSISPENSNFVLVTFTGDTAVSIKKYIAEGRHKYLLPLSAEFKTILLDKDDCVLIGVIIETYASFQ